MKQFETDFINVLKRKKSSSIPLYCPGYPEIDFLNKYINLYEIEIKSSDIILNQKNFEIIKRMGFDSISLWDFRCGEGGYNINDNTTVDGWGRIIKNNWYLWDGVFKNINTIDNWEHLSLPSKEDLTLLESKLPKLKEKLNIVLSLPGLFEKTWQSMGFIYFSRCLKNQDFSLIYRVIDFFSEYLKKLISTLQKIGVDLFLVADDCGYKKNEFISTNLWKKLFLERYQELVTKIHNKNNLIILHSDGYISNLMDIFVEIGFDAIQSLEPSAGVDIFQLFEKFTDKICFIGNLDISIHLTFGNTSQIKSYILKLIEKAKQNNVSLIVSPTQQINTRVKPENVKAMIETTKTFDLLI
ncbi:MAG: uroporphyrinogen decarboxylase family protein [Promethearchaeota archaeon]